MVMSDSRMLDRHADVLGATIRAAIEQTKKKIADRIQNEAQRIAEEEVGKLFADLKFEYEVCKDFVDYGLKLNLIVKGAGEMWQGKENPK